jgi:hypothetical protein
MGAVRVQWRAIRAGDSAYAELLGYCGCRDGYGRNAVRQELRHAVDAVRAYAGLGPKSYTHAIVAQALIRASDFSQTQAALNEALQILGYTLSTRSYVAGNKVYATDFDSLLQRTR